MKTTIKLTAGKSLTVEPCARRGGIIATLAFELFGIKSSEPIHLTPDQCGALLVGIECANVPQVWQTVGQMQEDQKKYHALQDMRKSYESECG